MAGARNLTLKSYFESIDRKKILAEYSRLTWKIQCNVITLSLSWMTYPYSSKCHSHGKYFEIMFIAIVFIVKVRITLYWRFIRRIAPSIKNSGSSFFTSKYNALTIDSWYRVGVQDSDIVNWKWKSLTQ
jgi:Na+-transporting NADH:ubiquinone oxidoreductase subunit NqrB